MVEFSFLSTRAENFVYTFACDRNRPLFLISQSEWGFLCKVTNDEKSSLFDILVVALSKMKYTEGVQKRKLNAELQHIKNVKVKCEFGEIL